MCERWLRSSRQADHRRRTPPTQQSPPETFTRPGRSNKLPSLHRYGSECSAKDGVTVGVRLNPVITVSVHSAVVIYASDRIFRDHGTAEHHSSGLVADTILVVAHLVVVDRRGNGS